ncbi:MAG: transporter [Pseudonocardia sp.]|uniref:hypothetical protein n=1 Tax=Pseudonocardia sp. TaxID=60912 RepID=UPI0026021F80|nr:hypothetical protein [Pseudonocardia sp.]MCU1630048.1 transporter [Pseudonocardia sp.]
MAAKPTPASGRPAVPAPGPGGRLPRPLRPLRHRDYRLLALSIGASLFASGLWLVAIGIPLTFVLAGLVPAFLALAALFGRRLDRDELAHPLSPANAAV